jgi:hypothetical protein
MHVTDNSLTLAELTGRYAVCRLPADAEIPPWARGEFVSMTRTPDELSIVCLETQVPTAVRAEGSWICLALTGPLDFDLVGILVAIAGPLARAGISIFAVSTFDTDYLMIQAAQREPALAALRAAGHIVDEAKRSPE